MCGRFVLTMFRNRSCFNTVFTFRKQFLVVFSSGLYRDKKMWPTPICCKKKYSHVRPPLTITKENCIKTGAISKHCKVKSEGCHWTSLTRDHNSWFERILCCNGMFKCAVNIIYLMFSWQVEFWLATHVRPPLTITK
jgi:hypothetical protein